MESVLSSSVHLKISLRTGSTKFAGRRWSAWPNRSILTAYASLGRNPVKLCSVRSGCKGQEEIIFPAPPG